VIVNGGWVGGNMILRTGRKTRRAVCALSTAVVLSTSAAPALADEGGVSFWVPGFFGSLAAAPQQPGFSLVLIYYHLSASAGGDVAFARQVNRGNISANFTGALSANLDAHANLALAAPSYVFATPVLGGQAAFGLLVPYGRGEASVDATLTGALGPIGFTRSVGTSDGVTGFGDIAPLFSLRWNTGVHNVMTYITGNLTTGRYDPARLVNLGIGHNALDAGVGYTYFNPQTGYEASATLGFTYNFENTHTDYRNGVDMHLDFGASKFVTKQWQLGIVGYLYQQISCDTGGGDRVGCFKSRVLGLGPQIGYTFPLNEDYMGYVNLKGYGEFAAENRASGWNLWLTFAMSPAPKK
jgi:hypothetical protein